MNNFHCGFSIYIIKDNIMATYNLTNFLAIPSATDTKLKIYDSVSTLKYMLNPTFAYFHCDANIVNIRIEDNDFIKLDFPTSDDAVKALVKLNDARQILLVPDTESLISDITVYSKDNLNMIANQTINDGDCACNTPIANFPTISSFVRVLVNGVEIRIGGKMYPYDAYFSPDEGLTVRVIGDERLGDKLFWNGSIAEYNLDEFDLIDFIYLIVVDK